MISKLCIPHWLVANSQYWSGSKHCLNMIAQRLACGAVIFGLRVVWTARCNWKMQVAPFTCAEYDTTQTKAIQQNWKTSVMPANLRVHMCVRARARVCVCVIERQTDRQRQKQRARERDKQTDREYILGSQSRQTNRQREHPSKSK